MECDPRVIFLDIDLSGDADPFLAAKLAAEARAEAEAGPAMLVSWKNNRTGEFSPNVIACKECSLDGWEMYAQSRGADLRVEVNGGDYIFIFKALGK